MKRIIIISAFIAFSYVSVALAQNYDLSEIFKAKLVIEYPTDTTVDEMDTVTFGAYPQSYESGTKMEPIEWLILKSVRSFLVMLKKYQK